LAAEGRKEACRGPDKWISRKQKISVYGMHSREKALKRET
jgi:hypothetical protein